MLLLSELESAGGRVNIDARRKGVPIPEAESFRSSDGRDLRLVCLSSSTKMRTPDMEFLRRMELRFRGVIPLWPSSNPFPLGLRVIVLRIDIGVDDCDASPPSTGDGRVRLTALDIRRANFGVVDALR